MGLDQVCLVVLYTLAFRWLLFESNPALLWMDLLDLLEGAAKDENNKKSDRKRLLWIFVKLEYLTRCVYCQTLWSGLIVFLVYQYFPISQIILVPLLAAYVGYHSHAFLDACTDRDEEQLELAAIEEAIEAIDGLPDKGEDDKPILTVVTTKQELETPWTNEESK